MAQNNFIAYLFDHKIQQQLDRHSKGLRVREYGEGVGGLRSTK